MNDYYSAGPLTFLFGKDSVPARILDQSMIMGNMIFTVPVMLEATGLEAEAEQVSKCLQRLISIGWLNKTKQHGKRAYRFNMVKMREFVHWGTVFQLTPRKRRADKNLVTSRRAKDEKTSNIADRILQGNTARG